MHRALETPHPFHSNSAPAIATIPPSTPAPGAPIGAAAPLDGAGVLALAVVPDAADGEGSTEAPDGEGVECGCCFGEYIFVRILSFSSYSRLPPPHVSATHHRRLS